jgi:hypothetical protein
LATELFLWKPTGYSGMVLPPSVLGKIVEKLGCDVSRNLLPEKVYPHFSNRPLSKNEDKVHLTLFTLHEPTEANLLSLAIALVRTTQWMYSGGTLTSVFLTDPKLAGSFLQNYDISTDIQAAALEQLIRLIGLPETYVEPAGVYLHGTPGTGKSHLAMGVVAEWLGAGLVIDDQLFCGDSFGMASGRYPELGRKSTDSGGPSISYLDGVKYYIYDDAQLTDKRFDAMLDHFFENPHGARMVITSNYPMEEVALSLGSRGHGVLDRMKGAFKSFDLSGESHRKPSW